MDRQKLRNLLLILLPVIVVMLTMLPNAAQIQCLAEDGVEEIIENYSGFNSIVLANGNFGPMITGILCAIIAVLCTVSLVMKSKKLFCTAASLSMVALASSLMPLLVGAMTEIGWRIFALLDVEIALVCDILLAFL